MKKTLIGIIVAMFSFGSASADAGVNIGLSGVGAIFGASATETDTGPDETEKVSDTDIMGGNISGMITVLVKTGKFDNKRKTKEEKPDFKINSISELLTLVKKI